MIFDFAGVERVLSDHETFSSRHGPDWLSFTDPPRHTKLRALVSRAFTPRSVAALEGRIAELSRGLLERVSDRGADRGGNGEMVAGSTSASARRWRGLKRGSR